MIRDEWLAFLAMDGHALYVWGSYAVALVLALTEIALLLLRRHAILGYLGWHAGPSTRGAAASAEATAIAPEKSGDSAIGPGRKQGAP